MKQSGIIGLCRLCAGNITTVTLNFLFGVASRNNNGSLKVAQHFYIWGVVTYELFAYSKNV